MKFKEYIAIISDPAGFIPTPRLQWIIRKNTRATAREEAILGAVIEQANPRENVTGSFSWNAEEQPILQQLWITPDRVDAEWRDVDIKGAEDLFTEVETKFGPMPVPNAVKEPGVVPMDLKNRVREMLGEDGGE